MLNKSFDQIQSVSVMRENNSRGGYMGQNKKNFI